MPGRSIRIMSIGGIPLGVQPLWIVIVALITWSLGADYYPSQLPGISPAGAYALGFASALLLFASIVAHEFGHALTARRRGVEVEGIDLWLLGGVAKMSGQPRRPEDELRYALAGPLVTVAVVAVFAALALLLPSSVPAAVHELVYYQVYVNAVILVFNMLPAFPLDGGRVARALLWRHSGDLTRATRQAAAIGRGFAWFFIALGAMQALAGAVSGVWFMIVGFFILMAAGAESRQTEIKSAFMGYRAADVMSAPAVTLPAEATLFDAALAFERYRYTSFPVTEDGSVVGLLSIAVLEHLPPQSWSGTRVGEVCDRDPSLFIHAGDDVTDLLDSEGFSRDGRAIVLAPSGALAGIVSLTDIQRKLRTMRLRSRSGGLSG